MKRFLEFLQSIDIDRQPHTDRGLLQHLIGTQELLAEWGCSEHICTAGLFHSIYGTTIYKHKTLRISARKELRELIGAPSEDLVYLFSVCDRPEALLESVRCWPAETKFRKSNRVSAKVNSEQLAAIAEIECANIMEQTHGAKLQRSFDVYLSSLLNCISCSVRERALLTLKSKTGHF